MFDRHERIGDAMRYRYLIAWITLLIMPTVLSRASETSDDESLSSDRSAGQESVSGNSAAIEIESKFLGEAGWARFRLAGGRIELDPMRYRKGDKRCRSDSHHEHISISTQKGIPTVCYQYEDEYQRIHVTAEHGHLLRIESVLAATGESAILIQETNEPIVWKIRVHAGREHVLDQELTIDTWMHLLGRDPSGFEIHLERIVRAMLSGVDLFDLSLRTEERLVRQLPNEEPVTEPRISALIDRLASPIYRVRRAATIELTRIGYPSIPLLRQRVREQRLDAEQMARITKLLGRTINGNDDTPASLASMLSLDRAHWEILASRFDHEVWIAANAHLRRCGLTPMTR
ncbi:MAG: hypothetical protein AAF802_09825 [Planctomycetota bacterium]